MKGLRFTSLSLASLAFVAMTPSAHAQATHQTVEFSFGGIVTENETTTAQVRPGVLAPGTEFDPTYNGAEPQLGGTYFLGTQLALFVRAILPTKAYFDSIGLEPTDGFYRFIAGTNYYTGGGPASIAFADLQGPIDPVLRAGQPTNNRAQFVLDAATGQYSLAPGLQGESDVVFASSAWDGPSFFFDPVTQNFTAAPSSCLNAQRSSCTLGGDGGFGLVATATNLAINGIQFHSQDPNFPGQYYWSGSYDINIEGNWSLPVYGSTSGNTTSGNPGSGGNPTDVPAPSVVFLMAAGLAAAGWRNRKRPTR